MGKYEREEVKPTIDVAIKLAKLVGTTVGYLLGEIKESGVLKDSERLNSLNDIASLLDDNKSHILYAIDNLLVSVKTRVAYK
jgi:DNA-binding XRE family transcriptional regulator